jgi:coenzyme F420 hydrogenase subunit beta
MTHESVGARVDHDPIPVERIVESGLCIGCGLCESIAGQRRIRLMMTPEGRERPAVLEPLDRETLALINAVCPGMRVEGPDPKATDARAQWDAIWGPAIRIAKGYAGDPQVRFQGSAGGGLSALAIYLLEKSEVDFILHVAASREKPMRSERHLSFDRAQVLAGAGSRYGPAAPLTDFVSLLEHGRPFAVIAKPCDLAAIRNLANEDPRVDRLVRYHLGFVCGGASVFAKSLELVRSFGLEEDDVAMLRYRGMGNPGKTRVEAKDGRAFEVTYNDLWEDESKWMLQFRCKICPDAIGELADIAVSDVWPGGGPTGEDAGFNGFIARTPRGLALLEEAERAGALVLLEDWDFRDLDRVQPHQVTKKQAITARLNAMRDADVLTPSFRQLRLEAAAATSTEEDRRANYLGMQDRLKRGDNQEPLTDFHSTESPPPGASRRPPLSRGR